MSICCVYISSILGIVQRLNLPQLGWMSRLRLKRVVSRMSLIGSFLNLVELARLSTTLCHSESVKRAEF